MFEVRLSTVGWCQGLEECYCSLFSVLVVEVVVIVVIINYGTNCCRVCCLKLLISARRVSNGVQVRQMFPAPDFNIYSLLVIPQFDINLFRFRFIMSISFTFAVSTVSI